MKVEIAPATRKFIELLESEPRCEVLKQYKIRHLRGGAIMPTERLSDRLTAAGLFAYPIRGSLLFQVTGTLTGQIRAEIVAPGKATFRSSNTAIHNLINRR